MYLVLLYSGHLVVGIRDSATSQSAPSEKFLKIGSIDIEVVPKHPSEGKFVRFHVTNILNLGCINITSA